MERGPVERVGRGGPYLGGVGVVVGLLLLLTGCATGMPVGMRLEARGLRYRPAVPYGFTGERRPPEATVESSRVAVLAERTPDFVPQRADYKQFIRGEREKLAQRPEEERRLEEAVLGDLEWWLWQQEEAQLARQHPLEVYLRMREVRQAEEKREAARWAAVEEKLGELVEKVALATGRSADEVQAMVRVARQVALEDAARLERISRTAARTGRLAEEDWDFLQRTAKHLDSVLAEFHEALKRGEKVPFLALRTGTDGLRMVPGSAEHMAQAWMEYQFRHPSNYPGFRYAPDETWRRMYRSILENKARGSAFEQAILQKLGHEKNTALLMPPPGSKLQGFIPDAVPGNPNPGELVWGQPYRFVESKAHKDLALTGNLKAMIDYVRAYGGHLELWVRSAKHPDGATRLTRPLQQEINRLRGLGRATLQPYP